jgi:hypothetical protein
MGTMLAHGSQMLLVFKCFESVQPATLATLGNASMQGVGTVLGTVRVSWTRIAATSIPVCHARWRSASRVNFNNLAAETTSRQQCV